jgi:hypothetical protein
MGNSVLLNFWSSNSVLRYFIVYAFPCLLCWGIFFLAYYPGMMSRDSLDQWIPVLTYEFNDWHPAILSYLYYLLSLVWRSPAVVCLAQMLGLAGVFSYGMVQFEKLELPGWALFLITAFFCLFPLNGFYVNTLFKDVPFGIAILLAFIYLMQIVETQGAWLKSGINLFLFAFTLSFIWVIRHNGILTVFAIFGALSVAYWPFIKRISLAIVFTLAMVFLVKGILYRAIGVHGRFPGIEMLISHQIAAVIHSGAKLTKAETQFIQKVLPLSVWEKKYDPFEVDDIVFDKDFNYTFLEEETVRKQYRSIWFSIISRNIPAFLQHHIKVTDLVWNIGLQHGSYNYAVHPLIDANDLGIQMRPFLPRLHTFLTNGINKANYTSPILRAVLLRPATYIYRFNFHFVHKPV